MIYICSDISLVCRFCLSRNSVIIGKKRFSDLIETVRFFRFVNSRLQDLNADYQESKEAYEEQQNAVVKEIIAIASGYAEPLHSLGEVVAKLDVLVGFAQV